ncbi:hypothetical protein HID58_033443 [Brassica napus]|uniref:Uncharacterized protein n=1 Tax=Brassica napus TaxID=3708 RepID=A0ABQ8BZ94_BRANA|nr:hypothetical protein HID58_033443 [Brassica napus]
MSIDYVKAILQCSVPPPLQCSKPKNEAETIQENNNPRKEVFVIKHRKNHERSKTTKTGPKDSTASEEKSTGTTTNQTPADCGRLSQSNSAAAAKTKRYSVSKRSFDFDNNGDADKADERRRSGRRSLAADSSAAARWRRVTSGAEETDSEQRSGSRRVSRSPERRSETTNPNNGIGSSVNSSNNNNIPAKFVSVPATDKEKRSSNNNADASIKRSYSSWRDKSYLEKDYSPCFYNVEEVSYISAPFGDYIASPLLLNIHGYKKLFLQTRVMYSILIHLNGQCVSEGGSKKSAENGFMTGGGCNSSSSRGIMSPELDVKFDYHYLPDSWSKLWSRSCNAALETNQCWVDKECLKHLKRSKSQDSYTTEEVRHKSWKW